MNPKLLLRLALVLSGVFGCKPRQIPSPPSADQVREWAGFPASFQLQATTESMTNMDAETQSMFGKPIWASSYENPKHSLITFEIIICQSGTLWSTNRTQAPKAVEKQIGVMRSLEMKSGAEFKAESPRHKFLANAIQILPLSNGCKAYFTLLGFGPGGTGLCGFSYERDYDLMVIENFDSEDVPVEERMKNPISPTNDLPVFFGKVEAFLDAQQNVRSKP